MRNRAYLWPALLIGVGVLALLVNVGAIPTDRLYRLADLWPLLLIIAGFVLLINRLRLPSNAETTASVLVVVIALIGAGAYVAAGPAISTGTHSMSARAPVGDIKQAILEVDAGASTLEVDGNPSGSPDDLFEAQISYSGPQPTISVDPGTGRVTVQQNGHFGFFGRQAIHLTIQLNSAVRWSFSIHSGASRDRYRLSGFQLGSVEIDTGASTEDIELPDPAGVVPVRINGGALTVSLHRPKGAAASVKVSGGAVRLEFDGDVSSAVGSVSHSSGNSSDILAVTVNGGTCNVTMDVASGLD